MFERSWPGAMADAPSSGADPGGGPTSTPTHHPPDSGPGASQGEALAAWALWAALLVVLLITYTRLDPSELYNVSRDGIAGGMSRVLVEVNYPVSLVAIAAVLVALDGLSPRCWRIGGPAIALCAVTAWPGVVDQDDLDARPINALPAIGVALALALTVAAAARSGSGLSARRPLDPGRAITAAAVLVLSVPWLAADLGFFVPEGVFIAERAVADSDGVVSPAVHLGHHHGLDGALLVVSALLLSRPRLGGPVVGKVVLPYLSLMFAYGAVNCGQDFWNEQLQKRGLVDWSIPSALRPTLTPIWLVVVALAVITYFVLRHEALASDRRTAEADAGRRDGRAPAPERPAGSR